MTKGQIKIAQIIAKRDGIPFIEAKGLVEDTLIQIDYALTNGTYDEVEDIVSSELGLEIDYIFDLLTF